MTEPPTSRATSITAEGAPITDENQIIAERRAKLAALRAEAGPAFPNQVHPSHSAQSLHLAHETQTREELEA
ncbi:MAG: lysine--tRNA ligase, partial [Burkholderiaceae bacterium]